MVIGLRREDVLENWQDTLKDIDLLEEAPIRKNPQMGNNDERMFGRDGPDALVALPVGSGAGRRPTGTVEIHEQSS